MSLKSRSIFALLLSTSVAFSGAAFGETIQGALAKAYTNNSQLNSARAGVRVIDENVAIAKSGYRPTINGTGNYTFTNQEGVQIQTGGFGVGISQTLFDGLQTLNNVRAAEAQVRGQNESLRNTEQNILFNAASAYMDVIRDRRIAALLKQNLAFLQEQVRAANSRLDVGEGTRTDVAQADATRASAVAQLAAARAQAESSEATYRQIVGDAPGELNAAAPVAKLLPSSLDASLAIAANEHPAIKANQYAVDATGYSVKSAEGALLPQVNLQAGVQRSFQDSSPGRPTSDGTYNTANVGAQVTIPIYDGGRTHATIRRNKEQLGQTRIDVDVSRDQVRQAVTAAWTQFVAAKETVSANRDLVSAAQLALNGVQEELNVGQRTTLDVLNAQADVITAQVNLANSEHNVVVASYAILSAMGRLSVERLSLQVTKYEPKEHYNAVKDKWFGLRTPDAR